MDIKNILINKISPSPINPRKSFDGATCPDEKSGDVININDAYKIEKHDYNITLVNCLPLLLMHHLFLFRLFLPLNPRTFPECPDIAT